MKELKIIPLYDKINVSDESIKNANPLLGAFGGNKSSKHFRTIDGKIFCFSKKRWQKNNGVLNYLNNKI